MNCKFCGTLLTHEILDLGHQPPSNALLTKEQLEDAEIHYPLKVFLCDKCKLVQVPEYKPAREIFVHNYAYHSSQSPSWVEHARKYVQMIINRLGLNVESHVLEIGSNDGYLLQHFVERRIPCIGVDPATQATAVANQRGIYAISKFFTSKLAKTLPFCDLILGINVFAHVPDINDFIKGMRIVLKPSGVITMEFPHLFCLMNHCLFDTIYHEHYFYYSLRIVRQMFDFHGLQVFDVEELPTHGGSLRVYVQHQNGKRVVTKRVQEIIEKETMYGLNDPETYNGLQSQVRKVKHDLLEVINGIPCDKIMVAYGAAAKGNTLLNYCGIRKDTIPFIVDISPYKQGKYLPGSHIRIVPEEELIQTQPDYVLVLPWNLRKEIMKQLSYIKKWKGKFVIPMPEVEVI